MSMQDPISDMLTRLRNGSMAMQKEVAIPSSKLKVAIAKVLEEEGYIKGFRVDGDVKKTLFVEMKYFQRRSVVEGLERVSKPSCRLYCGSKDIPKVKDGLGIAILSTPKGILSGRNAEKQNVGGEILCDENTAASFCPYCENPTIMPTRLSGGESYGQWSGCCRRRQTWQTCLYSSREYRSCCGRL